jgi:hypothetical protein
VVGLQNCPLNTRKEFCLTSCKFRRGNYLKERLSINRGKLHSRYVLERHIEMGVAGTVLEDRRKELQAINDVITMERKGVKRKVKIKVKKGTGKGK